MIQITVDTSVVVGLLDHQDIWHTKSVALKNALIKIEAQIAVFDCVLAEAISVLARRFHEKRRQQEFIALVPSILNSYPPESIFWVFPTVPQKYLAVVDLIQTSDGELNFNDALIALTCQAYDIPFIASFDRDFDKVDWLKRVASPQNLAK